MQSGLRERAPVFTSMAVDLTVTNLLPASPAEGALFPGSVLAEALKERRASGSPRLPRSRLIKITPIHLGLLNALLTPENLSGAAHPLVIGADFLSAEPTFFRPEHAPGGRLMNEYGPTGSNHPTYRTRRADDG